MGDLPARIQACADIWTLRIGLPYEESQVALVLPVTLADSTPAILKLQFPHSESEHEAAALRRWNGQGAVRLFAFEPKYHALLLEKCEPGNPLSSIGPEEALETLTELLPRLWIEANRPFVLLGEESAKWAGNLPVSWERAFGTLKVNKFSSIRTCMGTMCCERSGNHGWS